MSSVDESYELSYEYCDDNALPAERTNVTSLNYNEFYKLCPASLIVVKSDKNDDTDVVSQEEQYAPLGQPRCGDGSNYSFLVTRPKKQPKEGSRDKIVLELAGGGACWDASTCRLQTFFLNFPALYDGFLETSCSSVGDSLLCAKTIGNTDFSEYTSVFVPYCTQDVHLGDAPNTLYTNQKIHHVGAHNMYRTLQWIFDNFPNPSDVLITGCSAGGTPLPVIYDLVNRHYAATTDQQVNIDVVADSPVFLTPSYFLENYLDNWNVGTILELMEFDFDTYKTQESFPVEIINHSLSRSKDTDNFGFAQHDADSVSIMYYNMMNGGSDGDSFGFGGRHHRMLSEMHQDQSSSIVVAPKNIRQRARRRVNTVIDEWWSNMTTALNKAKDNHDNFDAFIMDGTGHCSFGLNVPLGEDGFEEWMSTTILQAKDGDANNSSVSPDDQPASRSMAGQPAVTSNFAMTAMVLLTWKLVFSSR